jgi:hypothetical protein
MNALFDLLQDAGFRPIWVGAEIHLETHGEGVVVRGHGDRYSVSVAVGTGVSRICDDPEAVVATVTYWS